jgi:hypothetical protein
VPKIAESVVVDPPHAAEVDELEVVPDLDDVVRLEVAVDQAEVVQVLEGREDLDDVGEAWSTGSGS